jgi:hypothetical protein
MAGCEPISVVLPGIETGRVRQEWTYTRRRVSQIQSLHGERLILSQQASHDQEPIKPAAKHANQTTRWYGPENPRI